MKRVLVYLALLLPLSACGDVARLVSSNGDGHAPAHVAFSTTVASSSQQDVSLRVAAYYLKVNGDRVAIGVITRPLTDASVQTVPLPIDLGTCMADPQRQGVGTADADTCAVLLDVQLIVGTSVVDKQLVGPLKLTPGASTQVPDGVTLSVIRFVNLHIGSGPSLPPETSLDVLRGNTATLRAVILDDEGREVTNRTVQWSSTAPQVASVSADGTITGLTTGTTTIRASVGEISSQVVVNVKPNLATLAIEALQGIGQGRVVSVPAGIDCLIAGNSATGACSFGFPIGTVVTLTSSASSGNRFLAWGDACNSASGDECQIAVTAPRTVGAMFTALRRVTVTSEGDGSGTVSSTAGVNCTVTLGNAQGACSVEVVDGTVVTLVAAPTQGGGGVAHLFDGWGNACSSSTGTTCVISATGADVLVSARLYAPKPLNVLLAGNGNGTVTSEVGLACSLTDGAQTGACSTTLLHGRTVVLVAAPNPMSEFAGWAGACAHESGPVCSTDMTSARTVNAAFTRAKAVLSLEMLGGGAGTIRVNGVDRCSIELGDASEICHIEFDAGTVLTVTAAAGANSTFSGFEASCSGTLPCTVALDNSQTVRAVFAANLVTVRVVAMTGTGSGRIVGVDGVEFDCLLTSSQGAQGDCVALVPFGRTIVVRAAPNANNALTEWGGACAGTNILRCTLTVGPNNDVTASFSPAINVRMNISGNGGGRVEFHFPGIPLQDPCISDGSSLVVCTFAKPSGVAGTFHAMPNLGSTFSGFTGPCSNTGSPPFPTCVYRGIGLARDVFGSFNK